MAAADRLDPAAEDSPRPWVKHPGESDGTCNGGPAAGLWWRAGALALLGK
ncbi:MAG: hypothetical protein ABWX57_09565 [Aeromicrobium sp.]